MLELILEMESRVGVGNCVGVSCWSWYLRWRLMLELAIEMETHVGVGT